MTAETFFTRRWNNYLTMGLGIPFLIWAYLGLATDLLTGFVSFIGMVAIAVVY